MKIFDCFPLFNELDLLHVRLELLYNHVDYFIISECDSTFSGLDKPFNFELNKDRYKKYADKIIYLKNYNTKDINNYENIYTGIKHKIYNNILQHYYSVKNTALTDYGKPHWCRDFIHKEYITLGMDMCHDDDIIMFSDLDEIPNINKLIFDGNIHVLLQKNMTYYIDKEAVSMLPWLGGIIVPYKKVKDNSLQILRGARCTYNQIKDAGWHLTNMGGTNRIIEKIKSYGHQEFNNINTINNIEYDVKNNKDIFNRNIAINTVDLDSTYPANLLTFIKQNYTYLIG